jgi:hypothetical protein
LRFLTKEAVEETLGVYRMQSERNLSCPRTSTEFGKRHGNFMGGQLIGSGEMCGKKRPYSTTFLFATTRNLTIPTNFFA